MLGEIFDRLRRLKNRLKLWENDWRFKRVGVSYILSIAGEVLDQVEALLNELERHVKAN